MMSPTDLTIRLISLESVDQYVKDDVIHTFDTFMQHLDKHSETWLLAFAIASLKLYMDVYNFTKNSISKISTLMGALLVCYGREEVLDYDILSHMQKEMGE